MRSNGVMKLYDCFCRMKIQESNILEHSLRCEDFKKVFEGFPVHLHNVINNIKDGDILRLFIGVLSNARSICELKLKGPPNLPQVVPAKLNP